MRAFPLLLLALAAALAVPSVAAQGERLVPAGTHLDFLVDARDGQALSIDVTSDVPVDVFLVRGGDGEAYFAGNATQVWAVLNGTEAHAGFDLQDAAGLWVVVDNSPRPDGGASGDADAQVTVSIVVEDPADAGSGPLDRHERHTFWNALMFTAPSWDLGSAVGLGGVFLWFLAFAALAAYGFKPPYGRIGTLAAGVAGLAFLWSLVPHPGVVSQVGLPMLFGAGAGWLGAKGTRTLPQALRLAFLGAFLGAAAGLAAGHLVRGLWADDGMLVLGAGRFDGALFVLPVTAVFVAALLKVLPAFVEALEDEERPAAEARPGLGLAFTVSCLRCGTAITVNRSLKRYRVATDRYEFPCPNCHAWMEWAEPKDGASAAA